ncbi:MAG TPA: hypothetical protein DD465_01915 [Thalassospira sp.]|jgi:hypothetical protein|nr:hypothetical protein [Thalassospira sp.]|tara:strand:+ start:2834 stop:3298 length:465 start_codon:yes stop_codon:yes gene_type:complete
MMRNIFKLVTGAITGGGMIWWIAGGVAFLIAAVGVQTIRLDGAQARIEAEQMRSVRWRDASIENMETINRLRLAGARIERALADERDRRSGLEARYRTLMEGVNDAPNDGCVGPAVRGLFDRLRDDAGTDLDNGIYRGDRAEGLNRLQARSGDS